MPSSPLGREQLSLGCAVKQGLDAALQFRDVGVVFELPRPGLVVVLPHKAGDCIPLLTLSDGRSAFKRMEHLHPAIKLILQYLSLASHIKFSFPPFFLLIEFYCSIPVGRCGRCRKYLLQVLVPTLPYNSRLRSNDDNGFMVEMHTECIFTWSGDVRPAGNEVQTIQQD